MEVLSTCAVLLPPPGNATNDHNPKRCFRIQDFDTLLAKGVDHTPCLVQSWRQASECTHRKPLARIPHSRKDRSSRSTNRGTWRSRRCCLAQTGRLTECGLHCYNRTSGSAESGHGTNSDSRSGGMSATGPCPHACVRASRGGCLHPRHPPRPQPRMPGPSRRVL